MYVVAILPRTCTQNTSSGVMQVLDEIGIDLSAKLGQAPKHRTAVAAAQPASAEDEELRKMLAALK